METEHDQDQDQEQKNDRELQAWMAWKELCSVQSVRDFAPYEYKDILWDLISGKFAHAVHKINKLEKNNLKIADCIQEFDSTMWQFKKPLTKSENVVSERIKKSIQTDADFRKWIRKMSDSDYYRVNSIGPSTYKDFIFFLAENSSDSPLQVIRGKVTGPLGYLNDIVKKYLLAHFPCKMEIITAPDGRKVSRLVFQRSKDEEISDAESENNETFEDVISQNGETDIYNSVRENKAVDHFLSMLTSREKIALLAKAHGIHVSEPAVCRAMNCQKSQAAVAKDHMLNKLKHSEYSNDGRIMMQAVSSIFSDLKSEKRAEDFLSLVAKRDEE